MGRIGGVVMAIAGALGLLMAGLAVSAAPDAPDIQFGTHRFDGIAPAPRAEGRFENPGGPIVRAGPSVTLPFFGRRIAARFGNPVGLPPTVELSGWSLRSAPEPRVTWLGHASVLVQMDGVTFLTDPNWSQTAGPTGFAGAVRLVDPPLPIETLPPIDFVVISHNHYDHLDLPTLRELARLNADLVVFTPLGHAELLGEFVRVVELDWGQWADFSGVRVHCLPSRHWSRRGLFDMQRSLWSGWAITGPGRRFYYAGDTAVFEGFRAIGAALGPFDLAALPVGAYEPIPMMRDSHINPEEAARAALEVRATRAMAVHYGTFDLSDEPQDDPPRRFRDAMRAEGAADEAIWVLAIGESRPF
jgi:N-acyl-phosphatidylethanolamine-hydrolysing phospholipase D